jgi:hypothetical protein
MSAATPQWAPYATVPQGGVPRKLGDHRVRLFAIGAILALVVVISAVATLVHPGPQPCGLYCGPQSQPPLAAASTYTNSAHGFSIDYPADRLSVSADKPDSVEFHSDGGPIEFQVVRAASLEDAVSQAQQQLDSSVFQDMQEVGPVRGAELGYVPGRGTVWSATYQPPDGGDSGPVRIAIIAAQSGGLTVVATMFSDYDSGTDHAPYGLSGDATFDYPISGFHFPGRQ